MKESLFLVGFSLFLITLFGLAYWGYSSQNPESKEKQKKQLPFVMIAMVAIWASMVFIFESNFSIFFPILFSIYYFKNWKTFNKKERNIGIILLLLIILGYLTKLIL